MRGNQEKLNSALHVCCININCSTNAMHALAHNIATSEQDLNILLVQEPWWNGSITTAFQGWQVILPTPTIKDSVGGITVCYEACLQSLVSWVRAYCRDCIIFGISF